MTHLDGFFGMLVDGMGRAEAIPAPWAHESREGEGMGKRFTHGGRVDNQDKGPYEKGTPMREQDERARASQQVEREASRAVAEVGERPRRQGAELARELEDIYRLGVKRPRVAGAPCQCEHRDHDDGDGGACHGRAELVKLTLHGRYAVCLSCVGRGHLQAWPVELEEDCGGVIVGRDRFTLEVTEPSADDRELALRLAREVERDAHQRQVEPLPVVGWKVLCAACGIGYEQTRGAKPSCCGACGDAWIAVKLVTL